MSKGHGKDQYLAIDDTGAILRNLSTFIDNADFDRSVDLADATTVGAESKTFLPGLDGAGLEVSGKYDDTAVSGPDVVLAALFVAKLPVDFEFGPFGNAVGKPKYSGLCYVERYRISAPLEGVIKFSVTLRVNGAPARGAF